MAQVNITLEMEVLKGLFTSDGKDKALCANIDVASIEGGIYALFEVSQGKYFKASTAT